MDRPLRPEELLACLAALDERQRRELARFLLGLPIPRATPFDPSDPFGGVTIRVPVVSHQLSVVSPENAQYGTGPD